MLDQLGTEGGPCPALDRSVGRRCERAALGVVAHQVHHVGPQRGQVARLVQPAGAGVLDQVQRAAAAGGDHRHARGHRLLDGLAEGLELAGVDEEIEGRHRAGQLPAAEEPGEDRVRQGVLEGLPLGSVAHNHQPGAGDIGQHGEVLHLFFDREPAHVADDALAGRGHGGPPAGVALARGEPLRVHAAPPHLDPRNAAAAELVEREAGGGEGPGRQQVDVLHPVPGPVLQEGDAVAPGVARDLGLVDGYGGDPQLVGGLRRAPAEHERRRQVDHVRCILGKDSLDPRDTAHRHPDVRVAGQRHRGQPVDMRPVDLVGGLRVLRGRRDHQHLVSALLQMLQDPQDGVGDPIHQRQE